MSHSTSDVDFDWAPPDAVPANAPIYMDARYQSLIAEHDGSDARVLLCRAGERTAQLPLLVRDLGPRAREAYSAYGYGGFLGDPMLSADAIGGLRRHLADDGIVALFLRHSPFLANQAAMPGGLSRLNRLTYAADLQRDNSFAAFLARVPKKLRWSANFALRAGLRVVFHPLSDGADEKILAFYAQYRAVMEAKGTAGYHLFSEHFFLEHARRLGGDCQLAEVTNDRGDFLGGAFFLVDRSGWVHYHLSAAPRETMKLRAMELLILSALHRFGNAGYRALHLGGGHALDESDGLSRFKSKFASHKLEFHISTLVCDETSYQRERARLPLAHPGFFLVADARGNPPPAPADHLARNA